MTSTNPIHALAGTRHLARYMLTGDPYDADLILAVNRPEAPASWERDRIVLAVDRDDGVYLVRDHGTWTTRRDLPDWTTDEDIVDIELPRSGDTVWQTLQERARTLRELSEERYDEARIGETLAVLKPFHSADVSRESASLLAANPPGLYAVDADQVGALLADSDAARTWAWNGIGHVRDEYGALRLTCAGAAGAIATLAYLTMLTDPRVGLTAGLLRSARPDLKQDAVLELSQDAARAAAAIAASPAEGARLGIPFDVGFYATHVQLTGGPGLQRAWDASTWLAKLGSEMLDRARRLGLLEGFCLGLSLAQAHFAASDQISRFLAELYAASEADASADFAGLEARRVLCEERRVTIIAALAHVTGINADDLNPGDFTSLQTVAAALANEPRRTAEAWLHDRALRLAIPVFTRDLLLGMTHRRAGRLDAAKPALERTLQAVSEARELRVPTEPNFQVLIERELGAMRG
jgi:hypothetical protein